MRTFQPNYNFYELMSGVFLLEMDKNNDLGHTFLRAQEFYESVNPDIQGKDFTLEKYKNWYQSQSETGEFTYGEDWKGFNLPSKAIKLCYEINQERLEEDLFFLEICQICENRAKSANLENYYLLGVRRGDTKTLDHEIAHGLYTVNNTYKEKSDTLINKLSGEIKSYMSNWLEKKGYASSVHDDEIQAFFSTGLSDTMDKSKLEEITKIFEENFKKFVPNFVLPEPAIKKIIA